MEAQGFAVVTCQVGDAWLGWLWEQPYYSDHGETEDSVVAKLKARLDTELDRREKIDQQFKFRPGRWPTASPVGPDGQRLPSPSDIHDRVRRDAERRQLPLQRRTLAKWRESCPFVLRAAHLPLDADDSLFLAKVKDWVGLIANGDFDIALEMYPDMRTIVPLSDFPKPQFPATPNCLRKMLEGNGISFPMMLATSSGVASVIRYKARDEFRGITQKLICGVGDAVVGIEFPVRFAMHPREFIAKFQVFEMDHGLLITFQTLAVAH